MQEATARALIEILSRHAGEQNEILQEVERAEPPEEFQRIRSMIARTMSAIYLDALKPIFDEFPALKPASLA